MNGRDQRHTGEDRRIILKGR